MGWGGCGGPRLPNVRERYQTFRVASAPAARRAADPRTPADELRRLAADRRAGVRAAVASNPAAPPSLLEGLAGDRSARVHEGLASNRALPAALARALARCRFAVVRATLGENPAIPRDVLDVLLADADFGVKGSAVVNPQLAGEELLAALRWHTGYRTLLAYRAIDNPTVTDDDLVRWLEVGGLNIYMLEHRWFEHALFSRGPMSHRLQRAYVAAVNDGDHAMDRLADQRDLCPDVLPVLMSCETFQLALDGGGGDPSFVRRVVGHREATHAVIQALFARPDVEDLDPELAEWCRGQVARCTRCAMHPAVAPTGEPGQRCWTPLRKVRIPQVH